MKSTDRIASGNPLQRPWVRRALAVLLLILAAIVWFDHSVGATRLALVGYSDFQIARFARVNDSGWVNLERLSLKELHRSDDYDAVLLFGRGLTLDDVQKTQLKDAADAGTALYVAAQMHQGIDVTSVGEDVGKQLGQYLRYGGDTNYRNLLRYIRHEIDGKSYGMPLPDVPQPRSGDVLFYLDDGQVFSELKDYQQFYQRQPGYSPEGKTVAVLTSVPGPFNANRDHLDALIREIENRGMRVYPIASHSRRLQILKELTPDMVVFMPHGRLHRGTGKDTVAWFKQMNIPMFAPLSVFEDHDTWLEDAQGFSGGMLTMNVVMPELDGGILPTVINAQFMDDQGFQIFNAIDGRMPRFVDQLEHWSKLKREENRNKKLAIVYFRGPGKNALVAGNMEVAPSLHNTLKQLQQQGYDLTGLPQDFATFKELLARQGQVMAPYAPGLEAEFLREGNPALIDADIYRNWCENALPSGRCQAIESLYGKAPGNFMVTDHNGVTQIGVSRLRFGSVAILPQPLPGLGENTFQLVHGTDKAPPHSYAAVYLWIREAFKADAIMHFGTHGSLEFTPSKQVALSDRDWSDALLADTPHFYVYTVGNVGEAIIAKRRSYATILSHLTPPFQESGLYSDLKALSQRVGSFGQNHGEVKAQLRAQIIEMAGRIGLDKDLNMDLAFDLEEPTEQQVKHWEREVLSKLSEWLESIAEASITEGLYTLDNGYSNDQASNTAALMVIDGIVQAHDKIRQAMASEVPAVELQELTRDRAKRWIARALQGEPAGQILAGAFPEKLLSRLRPEVSKAQDSKEQASKAKDSKTKASVEGHPHARFVQGDKPKQSHAPFGGQHPGAVSHKPTGEEEEADFVAEQLIRLHRYLTLLPRYRDYLLQSTAAEQRSIANGFAGGYIEPSSGGDPIVNPASLPTGRNMYSIDAERTPTAAAWEVGKSMAQALLERHRHETGKYPKKVSFTLWPSEFIHTNGATLAQIFYLLGVEPVRDPFGRVLNLRVIPSERLGRPRIDIVVQSAGQFRDLAASRLALIEKAVAMAAKAPDVETNDAQYQNFVAQGVRTAEEYLLEKGLPPAKARALATRRSFGGLNGAYGTGIMGMVEASGDWQNDSQIAQQYIHNMGAAYGDSETWGEYEPHLFAAALLNTEVVVQPRSSNTWGALSLDHVYEFMGGLNLAVREVTGKDPAAYFSDYRNPNRARLQSHNEAVWEEARTTLLNPKFIRDMAEGGASSAETFAETLRNTFGWNVMKPEGIDDSIWNQLHDVYIRDKHNLQLREFFERENPYALQDFTGVMLEAARKQLWQASTEQIAELAELHAELIAEHQPGCGGFTCGNAPLQEFIKDTLAAQARSELQSQYQQQMDKAQTRPGETESLVLKKQEQQGASPKAAVKTSASGDSSEQLKSSKQDTEPAENPAVSQEASDRRVLLWLAAVVFLVLIGVAVLRGRRA